MRKPCRRSFPLPAPPEPPSPLKLTSCYTGYLISCATDVSFCKEIVIYYFKIGIIIDFLCSYIILEVTIVRKVLPCDLRLHYTTTIILAHKIMSSQDYMFLASMLQVENKYGDLTKLCLEHSIPLHKL